LYFHMPEPTASLTEPIMKMEVLSQRKRFWTGIASCRWKVKFNANFIIWYKDQLILTGELDDVGAPIRKIVETVIVLDGAWRYYCDHG
jgi:hypothetical protein